jgi:hypothetical protein
MGPWKGFWNLPGFTWRVKAKVDFGGNAAADVSGEKPADIVWTSDGRPCGRVSREDAKARSKGRRRFCESSLAHVVQLPKTFCGNEGVLECSGLTELWMGIERVDGKIQSGVKPPQSKKPGSGLNFWKMITFASWREISSPTALRPNHLQISDFNLYAAVENLLAIDGG